jgi:transcriptional regulator with XRE-family HTH domain
MTAQTLGIAVRRLREGRRLTQVELAQRAQVSQGYLAALESGLKTNPSLSTLTKLATALGVPVAKLLG